jgi:hypothetical protein
MSGVVRGGPTLFNEGEIMAEIINGLQIEVPAEELKTMLLGRLKYHQEKVTVYKDQYEKMAKVEGMLAEEATQISKTSNSRNPTDGIKEAIKKHEDQKVYYKFMSEHVVAGAVYRLNEQDLIRLGVQADRYY